MTDTIQQTQVLKHSLIQKHIHVVALMIFWQCQNYHVRINYDMFRSKAERIMANYTL